LEDHSFRVHFDPQHNPPDAIVKRSVDKDWGLLELTPEKRSLEEIFVDITTAEPATAEADTAKEEQAA
jgi:ABC-2 type transport system ATP-binding protein